MQKVTVQVPGASQREQQLITAIVASHHAGLSDRRGPGVHADVEAFCALYFPGSTLKIEDVQG